MPLASFGGLRRLLAGAGVLSFAQVLGCRSMTHEVRIEASPAEVWEVLVGLESYAEWNPFFVKAVGKLEAGETLEITMAPVGKAQQAFSPHVLSIKQEEELVWRGRLGVPGLFDGRHTFTIERIDDKTVLFRQYERFSGLLVPFAGLGPYRKGWELMDRALEQRVESGRPSSPPSLTR
jgi:hypothetical protein